jgi:hypothetical protein
MCGPAHTGRGWNNGRDHPNPFPSILGHRFKNHGNPALLPVLPVQAAAATNRFQRAARMGLKRPVRPHHYAFPLAGRLDQQYRSNPVIPVAGRSSF